MALSASAMELRASFSASPPPPPCPAHHNRPQYRDCKDCYRRQAWLDYTRQAAQAAGVWVGNVDPTPAREHLVAWRAAGGTLAAAARRCGVSINVLHAIYHQRQPSISSDSHDAILALDLPELPPPPAGKTYPHGSLRRVRGLCVAGWPTRLQRKLSGVQCLTMLTTVDFVLQSTADRLYDLAEELHERPGPSAVTAERARKKGWHSLDAWDDIDDPFCEPIIDDGPDKVLIEMMLNPHQRPEPPACYVQHRHPGRGQRVTTNCLQCRRWIASRDEAIRRGSLQPPYGPGLSANALAILIGERSRTVQRVRAKLRDAA